jgi:hypothetical protein
LRYSRPHDGPRRMNTGFLPSCNKHKTCRNLRTRKPAVYIAYTPGTAKYDGDNLIQLQDNFVKLLNITAHNRSLKAPRRPLQDSTSLRPLMPSQHADFPRFSASPHPCLNRPGHPFRARCRACVQAGPTHSFLRTNMGQALANYRVLRERLARQEKRFTNGCNADARPHKPFSELPE